MIISDDNNYIFVHIYKTGGSSLAKMTTSLVEDTYRQSQPRISGPGWQETWHYKGGQHWKMSDLRRQIAWADKDLSDYLLIAFTRNPYSWILSIWNNFYRDRTNPDALFFASMFPDRSFSSFCKFIEARASEKNPRAWGATTQGSFIIDRDVKDPFIGRFESLEEDMQRLAARFEITIDEVPHEIRDKPEARENTLEHYTPESIGIINRVFKEDFDQFSYQTV